MYYIYINILSIRYYIRNTNRYVLRIRKYIKYTQHMTCGKSMRRVFKLPHQYAKSNKVSALLQGLSFSISTFLFPSFPLNLTLATLFSLSLSILHLFTLLQS